MNFLTRIPKLAILALVLATTTWGGMFVIAKTALGFIDPLSLTAIRYSCTAILLTLILLYTEGKKAFRLEGKILALLGYGTLGFAGSSLFALWGLHYTQPANGAIIMASQPLITVLFNYFLKGIKPLGPTLACIMLALLGVTLVMREGPAAAGFNMHESLGNVLILLGAISWVIYSFGGTSYPQWSSLRYTTLSCLLGLVSIFLLMVLMSLSGQTALPSFEIIQNLLPELSYIIFAGSVLTFLCWNYGVKKLGPVNGVIFINLVPITTLVIMLMQGYALTPFKLIGALMVILAVIINNIFSRKGHWGQAWHDKLASSGNNGL